MDKYIEKKEINKILSERDELKAEVTELKIKIEELKLKCVALQMRNEVGQGISESANNLIKNMIKVEKKQAVKEFAEKLWNKIKDNGIDYKIGLRALGEEIDELLKEYEK